MFKKSNKKKEEAGIPLDKLNVPEGKTLPLQEIRESKVRVKEEIQKLGLDQRGAEEAALNYSISVLITNMPLEKLEMIEEYIIQIRGE